MQAIVIGSLAISRFQYSLLFFNVVARKMCAFSSGLRKSHPGVFERCFCLIEEAAGRKSIKELKSRIQQRLLKAFYNRGFLDAI